MVMSFIVACGLRSDGHRYGEHYAQSRGEVGEVGGDADDEREAGEFHVKHLCSCCDGAGQDEPGGDPGERPGFAVDGAEDEPEREFVEEEAGECEGDELGEGARQAAPKGAVGPVVEVVGVEGVEGAPEAGEGGRGEGADEQVEELLFGGAVADAALRVAGEGWAAAGGGGSGCGFHAGEVS